MAILLREHLIVAAIDFGTTYSGYAFSFLDDYRKDPCKISTNTWNAGSRGLLSLKAPTCALFEPNTRFHSFGYEAEDMYAQLAENGEANDWCFFRRFKMELYNKMIVNRDFELESCGGKKLPAMTVFSSCIKYLVDHLFKTCEARIMGILRTDIRWVLTVPAIWNDPAKQFMREAAEKAGIPRDQLLVALEPEAASIFCGHLPVERFSGVVGSFKPFQPGSKYLVLDAGGGTVDITVHEILNDDSLRELYRANGGDWGGTQVDKAFTDFMLDIVGKDVLEHVYQEDKSDLLDLYREFEVKKRSFKHNQGNKVTIKVPIALSEAYQQKYGRKIQDTISNMLKLKDKVSWMGDKLRVDANIAATFFEISCSAIVNHLEKLFEDPLVQDVSTILMVGGYSESPFLQEAVKRRFRQKRIIIPSEAGTVVLNGAVIFGHDPKRIKERICRYTYGTCILIPFLKGVHPESNLYVNDVGEELCDGIFQTFAVIGEPIRTGEPQFEATRTPADERQETMTISLYVSTDPDPRYVKDSSCSKLGELRIELAEKIGLDRLVKLTISISGTEIEVEIVEVNTGKLASAKFDFLG